MKILFTALLLFCYSPFVFSQNIEIQTVGEHTGYSSNTFPAGHGTVMVSGSRFVLGSSEITNPAAWSFSDSRQKAAFLQNNNGVKLTSYAADGQMLIEKDLEFFVPSDNTMKTYQFDSGRIILRDNVVNFSFLDPKGKVLYNQSNSSGSTAGEKESELAADPFGNTVVLYNPVISYNGQTGSRAQIVYGERDAKEFFRSRSEEIKNVRISDDGSFITLITNAGEEDTVLVFDRFGNQLFRVATDEDLLGATLNAHATYVTLYSSSRVQVYQIPDGERLGSASSRTSLIFADYNPASETILALGGNLKSRRINDPEIMAISLSKKEIARKKVPIALFVLNVDRIRIAGTAKNAYLISGLNRDLQVTIQF